MDTPDSQPERKLSNPLIDVVLVVPFFLILTVLLRSFVPSSETTIIWLVAAFTSASISGVFWIMIQMVRVILIGEKEIREKADLDKK